MAIRRATQYPGAMPEEIAFGKRRMDARHAPLRLDGSFVVAALISLLLVVPAVVVGWSVGKAGGAAGFAMAVAAGSVASVIITFLAASAWLRFGPGDRLFADATLTGWVRRGRAERRVAAARQVFDNPDVASIELHVDRLIAISRAVEARDARTHRHSIRVAIHATAAAKHLGLDRDAMSRLRAAAKLHDIGALREPVWLEPTEAERLAVALTGADLVAFTGDRRLIAALRHQREHFDGSGSPDGLAGDAIPLTARIIAVADAYDMVSRERGQSAALAALNAGAGSRFDPDVVEAMNAEAHASPIAALRGAVAGVSPKAAQGATDLLRGTASVAAAASIATGAVISTGVGAPPPSKDAPVGSSAQAAAAVAETPVSSSTSSRKERVAKSRGKETAQQEGSRSKTVGGGKGTSEQPGDDSSSSTQAPTEKKADAPVAPVEQLSTDLGETLDNTTQTVENVVTEVVETVTETIDPVIDTVDDVVGGVLPQKK